MEMWGWETPGLPSRGVCWGWGEFQTTGHNSRILKIGQLLSKSVVGSRSPVTYSTILKSKIISFFLTASKGYGEDSDHLRVSSALLWFMVLMGNSTIYAFFSLDVNLSCLLLSFNFFILEKGRESERERPMWEQHRLVASGMCPEGDRTCHLFVCRTKLQPTELCWPELSWLFFKEKTQEEPLISPQTA